VGDIHFGAEYVFTGSNQTTATQFNLGQAWGAASVDGYYSRVEDAVALASLSSQQVAALPKLGFSTDSSLMGTVSDNTAYAILGRYETGAGRLFAGYEYIRYANPSRSLSPGVTVPGGYVLAFINNDAYEPNRQLRAFWTGVKFRVAARLTISGAVYRYQQESYATGLSSACTNRSSPRCAGSESAASLTAECRLNQPLEVYLGSMYSWVQGGLASGFMHTSMLASTVGLRFSF
jgi:predicted porin